MKKYRPMKRLFAILTVIATLSVSNLYAQFTVEDTTKNKSTGNVTLQNPLQDMDISTEFSSAAQAKLERQRLRKERNYVEVSLSLQGTMTSYNQAWLESSKGGSNTMSVLGTFGLKHTFTNKRFSNNTQVNARYGYSRQNYKTENADNEAIWFKNVDEFWAQVQPKLALNERWAYTFLAKFRSQFSNSYKSATEQEDEHLKSGLLAPGYLDFSLGMDFASPWTKFPIKVSFFPLSGNGIIAKNSQVEENFRERNATSWFGIDIDKNFFFTGGSSIKLEFARSWGKSSWLSYNGNLYCYYGWITNVSTLPKIRAYRDYEAALEQWEAAGSPAGLEPKSVAHHEMLLPTIDWRNTITIKASSYFQTQIMFDLYYDKALSDSMMIKSFVSLGLTYTFKNK